MQPDAFTSQLDGVTVDDAGLPREVGCEGYRGGDRKNAITLILRRNMLMRFMSGAMYRNRHLCID
jgi:hypothetical protein